MNTNYCVMLKLSNNNILNLYRKNIIFSAGGEKTNFKSLPPVE